MLGRGDDAVTVVVELGGRLGLSVQSGWHRKAMAWEDSER